MQLVTSVEQSQPSPTYTPPAQRFSQGPRSGPPLIPPFKSGINDAAVLPFLAGVLLGSTLS